MKRILILLAASSSALVLAGCGDFGLKPPKGAKSAMTYRTISKLECPQEKGALTLVSAAPDGKSCAYKGDEVEVTLKLVSLNGGSARTALSPIETELKALMPDPEPAEGVSKDHTGEGRADIDLPGVRIQADDHGAKVSVAGVNIDANDDNSEVRIDHNIDASDDSGKTVNIKAGDGESQVEVKTDRERRTRRTSRSRGVRATYMMISEKGDIPYHLVGYEARGPRDGPLAVAVVKSQKGQDHENDVFDDAKALIRLNVGRGTDHIIID